jgi:hypothetical protein
MLTQELSLIHDLANPFLEPESSYRLEAARWRLKMLPRDSQTTRWEIDTPLRTRRSTGEYAQDQQGEYTVQANITTVWDVTRLGATELLVRDNVSTAIGITNNDGEIARWTMDMAAVAGAPGCGLHAQVKDHPEWFPKGFDVPRLPVFIPTLGAVLEYVLGELFQRTWAEHVAGHKLASSWRELQRRVWERWLAWQQAIVHASAVSPWLDIKAIGCASLNEHVY